MGSPANEETPVAARRNAGGPIFDGRIGAGRKMRSQRRPFKFWIFEEKSSQKGFFEETEIFSGRNDVLLNLKNS